MEEQNNQSNKNKAIKRSRLTRHTVLIAGTVIISIVLTYIILCSTMLAYFYNVGDNLRAGVESGADEYEKTKSMNDIYCASNTSAVENIVGFSSFFLSQNSVSQKSIDELSDVYMGTYCVLVYMDAEIDSDNEKVADLTRIITPTAKGVTASFDDGSLSLKSSSIANYSVTIDADELYEICNDHNTVELKSGFQATPQAIGSKGTIMAVYAINYTELLQKSVLSAYSEDRVEMIHRINTETGTIEDSSNEEFIGTDINTIFDFDQLMELEPEVIYYLNLADGQKATVLRGEEEYGQVFFSYELISDTIEDIIREIVFPIAISLTFLIIILVYVLKFVKKRQKMKSEEKEYVHLFGKWYVYRNLISHVTGMVGFAILISLFSVIYIKTLVNYSTQDSDAREGLQVLSRMITNDQENDIVMQDDHETTMGIAIDMIANYFSMYPDELTDDNLKSLLERMPGISSISVFDNSGTLVYDSSLYSGNYNFNKEDGVGYTLSKDENSPESVCWDVINGDKNIASYTIVNESTGNINYIVKRRQDSGGIIRIAETRDYISEFKYYTSIEKNVESANLGEADKAYAINNSEDTLIWMDSKSRTFSYKKNTLGDEIFTNSLAKVETVDGTGYYINTLPVGDTDDSGSTEYAVLAARRSINLLGFIDTKYLFGIIAAFVLQFILITAAAARKHKKVPAKAYKIGINYQLSEGIEERAMNSGFIKVIKKMSMVTCLYIIVVIGVDAIYSRSSLIAYLFGNQWPKGFGIFSFTMIMLLVAIAVLSGYVINKLIMFFTRNMGPRGLTIGHMVVSLIKFAILLIVVFMIVVDLGVEPSKILAGAGIASIILSVCAQQTVNDFLSGFFIVFEGLYNIGDWITVGDFRGEVIDIGVRTTKLAIGGNIQLINNSELKSVTIMAHDFRGAVCTVDIAYKEDVDRVISLIKDNLELYKSEIPYMLEGPYIDGVTELGNSGVTIRIWALSENDMILALERDLRRVTKHLFDENGVEIPFNQVTIHQGD